jgi:hypothetical protein
MTVSTMNLSQLSAALQADGVTEPVLTAGLHFLASDFHAPVQTSGFSVDGLESATERVLLVGADETAGSTDTVNTSGTYLKEIFALNGEQLTVTGSNGQNLFIGTDTSSGVTVTDHTTGNDTVVLNGAGDSASGGSGQDVLIAEHAGATLTGGSGNGQMLVSLGGGSMVVTGDGNSSDTVLLASDGNTVDNLNGSENHLLVTGDHNVVQDGGSGSFISLGDGANNVATVAGNGATIVVGEGATGDIVNVYGVGGEHIVGGAGGLTVFANMGGPVTLTVDGSSAKGVNSYVTLNWSDVSTDIASEVALPNGGEQITFNDGSILNVTNTIINFMDGTSLTIGGNTPHWAAADIQDAVNLVGVVRHHLAEALHHA